MTDNKYFNIFEALGDGDDDDDFDMPPSSRKTPTPPVITPEHGGNHFLGGTFSNPEKERAIIEAIAQAPWKSIAVQATHLTPYSVLDNVEKKEKLRPRIRTLSITYPNDIGEIFCESWDLDKLADDLKEMLLKAVLTNTVIAHDAIKQIGWIYNALEDCKVQVKPYPEFVLCSRLLAKLRLPNLERRIRTSSKQHLLDIVLQDNNKSKWSDFNLHSLGSYLEIANHQNLQVALFKENQYKYGLTLAPMHYRHSIQASIEPLIIAHQLLDPSFKKESDVNLQLTLASDFMRSSWQHHPRLNFYKEVFMPATEHFMHMTQKGIPFDITRAMYYKQNQSDALLNAIAKINAIEYPHLMPFIDVLKNPTKSLNDELNAAFVQTFRDYDPQIQFVIGDGGKPKLGAKELRKIQAHKGTAKQVYELLRDIQSSKQGFKTAQGFINFAYRAAERYNLGDDVLNRHYIRLHPLFGFNTETDRMSTEEPTTQNWKNDALFRSMIHAEKDHLIISADYSQIELRNAAALALRSQNNIQEILNNPDHKEPTDIGNQAIDIIRQIFGINDKETLDKGYKIYDQLDSSWTKILDMKLASFSDKTIRIPKTIRIGKREETIPLSYKDIKDIRDIIRLKKYAAKIRSIQIERNSIEPISFMAEAFRKDVDVHLLTALRFAISSGKIPLDENTDLVDYLSKLDKATINEMKESLSTDRRGAKATNFGLLYGMRTDTLWQQGIVTFNLDWTFEEAQKAEHLWFNLFPEIGLYQYFSILTPCWEGNINVVKNNQIAQKTQRYWKCVSLFGREYEVDDFKKGLNYQNQGTGAHAIQKAMAKMPNYLQRSLINQIHDESVAEIHKDRIEHAVSEKVLAMESAAAEVLAPFNIPVKVDIEVAEVWVHGDKPDEIPQEFIDSLSL